MLSEEWPGRVLHFTNWPANLFESPILGTSMLHRLNKMPPLGVASRSSALASSPCRLFPSLPVSHDLLMSGYLLVVLIVSANSLRSCKTGLSCPKDLAKVSNSNRPSASHHRQLVVTTFFLRNLFFFIIIILHWWQVMREVLPQRCNVSFPRGICCPPYLPSSSVILHERPYDTDFIALFRYCGLRYPS